MKAVKNILRLIVAFTLIVGLLGCEAVEPQVDNAPDTEYRDISYADVVDFASFEGQPYFAVAFLGYGDRMDFRNEYVEGVFESLGEDAVDGIQHIAYEGDEWYLIVPRYKNPVYIKNLSNDEEYTIYQGKAFTVNCNLSDLHPNIEIYTEDGYGAYKFSPQMGGDGKLITGTDDCDITDYSAISQ